nr:UBN2 domain-containing protein [Tanacetum cinerariifolium]
MVMTIEESKDLGTLPLDKLIGNLKVYEMILENDDVASNNTTKEKVKYLALKAKVTKEQTSNDSDSQGGNSSSRIIDPDVAIDLVTVLRYLKEVAEMVLEKKEVNAQDKGEIAAIVEKKVTSLVRVQSLKKTRTLLEELGVIVKTVMNLKTMQHVSWQSILK